MPLPRRQIAAIVAGNGLEFYDFVTFSFFAAQIGRTLFPTGAGHDLLFSLATFGVGFLTRPVGGLVIGRYADRHGRRPAMLLSFGLMGFAIVGLALTPSYAAIGMAAPALAVAFRLVQGFALGGEVGPNVAYLIEAAPPGRRGLYVSFSAATQDAAVLVAGAVGLLLSSRLSPAALDAWGWRVALLAGAAIVPFGLAVRRRLDETLPVADGVASEPLPDDRQRQRRAIAGGLLMIGGATIGNYTLEYLTTFAQTTLAMRVPEAFGATLALGAGGVAADLLSGWLSDRIGRRPVLLGGWLPLVALVLPAFLLLARFRSAAVLTGITGILSFLLSLAAGPVLILMAESLPPRVRAGSFGLAYALSVALFGGSAQVVEAALVRWTGNPLAPAWYMAAALALALSGLRLLPGAGRPARPAPAPALAA